MDTPSTSNLPQLLEPVAELLRTLSDSELMAGIDGERADGRAFGIVAETYRHELARRTSEAAQ